MRLTCVTCVNSPGADNVGAGLPTSPGLIWQERFTLERDTQQLLNSAPLMRLENGVLKLDVSLLGRISNSTCGDILRRFKDSLKRLGVSESDNTAEDCTPSNVYTSGVGNKRAARPEVRTASDGQRRLPPADSDWVATGPSYKKQKTNKNTAPESNTAEERPPPPQECATGTDGSYGFLSKPVEFMTVPVGCSSKDRITLYDKSKRQLTRVYIDVPRGAYSGMQLNCAQPSADFKLLLVDGDGFRVGGTTAVQHAVRLHVHRCKCMNTECNVLGCGSDPSFNIFKNVADPEVVKEYARHWASSKRQALKSHGQALRMRAGDSR